MSPASLTVSWTLSKTPPSAFRYVAVEQEHRHRIRWLLPGAVAADLVHMFGGRSDLRERVVSLMRPADDHTKTPAT